MLGFIKKRGSLRQVVSKTNSRHTTAGLVPASAVRYIFSIIGVKNIPSVFAKVEHFFYSLLRVSY